MVPRTAPAVQQTHARPQVRQKEASLAACPTFRQVLGQVVTVSQGVTPLAGRSGVRLWLAAAPHLFYSPPNLRLPEISHFH